MKHASHLPSDRSKCPQIPSPTFPGSLENLGLSLTIWNLNKNNGYSSCLYVLHVFFLHVFLKHVSHHVFQIPCVSPSLRQTYTEFWYVPMTKQSIEAAHVGCVRTHSLGMLGCCISSVDSQSVTLSTADAQSNLVGGSNHLEKYESQREGLSDILWNIKKHPNHQRKMHGRK